MFIPAPIGKRIFAGIIDYAVLTLIAIILSIIFGFIAMYFSDFSFSYTTTIGTYYNGYYPDILFPTAMALIVFGVNNFELKKS